MESVNPYQGFTEKQRGQARLRKAGILGMPGGVPWEAQDLPPDEIQKYRGALRRGKLESFKPAWEREFPEEPTGALGGITPPEVPSPTPLPPTRTALPEPTPRELSPELQDLTERFLEPIEPVTINKILRDTGKKAHEFTMTEMNTIVKKATIKGISRNDFYKEVGKLKVIWPELTREEELTALNKLADGFTADEILAHFRGK